VRLPRLVCVTGLAACGKSTVADALAAAAGRPVLSSDRIRKLRAGVDPYEYAGAAAYGDSESRAVYEELAQRATTAIRGEGGAIVDATFRRTTDADAFAAAAAAAASAAWIVCEAPPEVRLERAAARGALGSISDAGPAVIAHELAVHHGPFRPPGPPLARLDTTRPVGELLEALAAALDAHLGGTS
jgi:predicted kinase